MLGLGKANVKYKKWSPTWIPDLIGWWDFTDPAYMFQERDGTFVTPANTSNDPIGSIKNKAMQNNPLNRMGDYLYASSDAERPLLYKHPAATLDIWCASFNPSSNTHLLMEVEDPGGGGAVDYTGGVNSSTLSSSVIDVGNVTYLVVTRPDSATVTSDGCIMQITDYSDNNSATTIVQEEDAEKLEFKHNPVGGTSITIESTAAMSNTINKHLIISSGGRTDLYKNGTADGAETSWFAEGAQEMEFGGDHASLIIGESYRPNAGTVNGKNYDGKIFEILIYNRGISNSERDLLSRYMDSKYWST